MLQSCTATAEVMNGYYVVHAVLSEGQKCPIILVFYHLSLCMSYCAFTLT